MRRDSWIEFLFLLIFFAAIGLCLWLPNGKAILNISRYLILAAGILSCIFGIVRFMRLRDDPRKTDLG